MARLWFGLALSALCNPKASRYASQALNGEAKLNIGEESLKR